MTKRNCCAGLLLLLAAGGLLAPAWMFAGPKRGSKVPAGLSESDWREIRGVYERNREDLYPITIDPIAQQAYLKASNTDATTRLASQWRCRATRWWLGRPRGQQRHGCQRRPE